MTRAPIPVGVFGAAGATGAELIALLAEHPHTKVVFGTARSNAGTRLDEIEPGAPPLRLCHPDEVNLDSVEVVFTCLPHGASAGIVERCVSSGLRVIDLGGDLRLRDDALHEVTYGVERSADVMKRTAYGLTELQRPAIDAAQVIANPGCYPTCTGLPLAPLLASHTPIGHAIVVDAKSGVSGGGRAPTDVNHFCSAANDVRPYKVGRQHRHVPEIEQILADAAQQPTSARVIFNPHLVPLERGMLATIVVTLPSLSAEAAYGLISDAYADEPFIDVLPLGQSARIRGVVHTNRAAIGVQPVPGGDEVVLTCAIDNLVKGAAGQAIQNMNRMLSLRETEGLGRGLTLELS